MPNNYFPVTSTGLKKHKIFFPKVYVENFPPWLVAKRIEDGKIRITISDDAHGKSFTRDYSQLSIGKKYRYLEEKFLVDKRLEITFVGPSGERVNRTVTYFDSVQLLSEIDRLESMGKGYIRLTASMDAVDVFIDGVKKGVIENSKPFVAKLIEGNHRIQVKRDFFGSKAISVNIEADDAFAYHFDLKASGNLAEEMGQGKIVQSTGVLVVVTSRNDLSILIDGQNRIPPFKLPNISSGMHKMRINGPKGEKTVVVTVNESQKSLVDLDELY